jgi:hypothetical protein
MVGVIEENGVDELCFVDFDYGFCESCIGRLAGFCISSAVCVLFRQFVEV